MSELWSERGRKRRSPLISVLDKMIVLDLAGTLVSVLSVIVVIIVSKRFIKILEKAIEGAVSSETLIHVLGLKMISAAIAFLPAALFMAVLMVVGRMYRDQEMAAVFSAGGSSGIIYRSLYVLVLPLMLISFALSFYTGPWAEATVKELMHEDEKSADIRGIAAGRFSEYQHGDLVFYVEDLTKDGIMHQVFVQHRQGNKVSIFNAESGNLENRPGGLYLVLDNGRRTQGTPGQADYIIEEFVEYAVRLEEKETVLNYDHESIATGKLLESTEVRDIAELQRRFSIPAGVFVLSLLAVPLAQTAPRGGVYGNVLVAFLIYFAYGNFIRVSHSWVVKGQIPVWFGAVWVHVLLMILALILLMRLFGWSYLKESLRGKLGL
ncbi:LPS export ABC transporter permease LptF [Methylicorpusculum sp.]|uniref:LPS export ABC transporter permease LptF n=1 Tax=Methylicorpusculum sp. TaxID=2713644 RepID=UPI002ABBC94C|nr:LPS export ABC transporter permease LptF [Methylicorpusculum sp.]MDZ4149525.1 LPS export ABC transporter permease LptF [Methylicorpusculum sp.]